MTSLHAILESNVSRTLLAFAAICVTLLLSLFNRKRKALSYRVLRNQPLFRLPERYRNRVQITVDGVIFQDVSLVIIEVANTGNEAIKREDFDTPLTFSFGPGSEVLSAQLLGTTPPDLGAVINIVGNQVSLSPLLLNQRDELAAEVILSTTANAITHTCRVVGIPNVRNVTNDRDRKTRDRVRSLSLQLVIFATAYLIATSIQTYSHRASYYQHLAKAVLLGLLILDICIMIWQIRKSTKWP
jgi:hypothetical protein